MDMPVRDDSVRQQIVQAGGTPLRVAIRPGTGTGPPLLLCNGIGMRLEAWQPFVDALDPAIEVISFDAPGVGGSQLSSLPYRFTTLALLLRQMLHNLGYQQADVLGISWGGGLAQQFALLNPRLCRRLILVATATGPQTMVPPNPLPPVKNLILRRWGDLWGGSARTDPNGLTSALRMARISPLSMGFLYQNTAALGFTTLPLLPLIRQRTLVLTGDDDPIIPVANGRILAAGIPHATLHVYHGGHVELATRPSLLTPLITSFLAEPPRDARRAEQVQTGRHPEDQGPRQVADGTAAQATAEADALAEALQAARAAQQAAETAAGQAAAALRDARERAAAAQAAAREQAAAPEGASALRADEGLTGRDRERHIHSPRMFRSWSPSRSSARCPFRAYLVYAANFIRRELATACCPAQRWPESLYALSLR
jgi:poly(3-hydroxyalkanoate) depolymerase